MGAYDVYTVNEVTLEQGVYCGSPPPSYICATSTTIEVGGDNHEGLPGEVWSITVTWYSTASGGDPLPGVTAVDWWDKPVPLSHDDTEAALALYARLTGWDGTY